MLIHVDWLDLCWKTTLIDKMQKLFKNVVVFKTPKEYLPREDSKEARIKIWDFYIRRAREAYETLKKDPSKIIILDRFFLSELVYWKVIRKYTSNDMKNKISELTSVLSKINDEFGYYILYLEDNVDEIWERFKIDGDDYIKSKRYYQNLKKEFDFRIDQFSTKFTIYDINVFQDFDYWNTIIELVLLSNYNYKRQ